MEKISEISKKELEKIADRSFLPVQAHTLLANAMVIPITGEFLDTTRIWQEALEIYIKEHFDESD